MTSCAPPSVKILGHIVEVDLHPLVTRVSLYITPTQKQVTVLNKTLVKDWRILPFILKAFETVWDCHGLESKSKDSPEVAAARADAMAIISAYTGGKPRVKKFAGSYWTRWLRVAHAGKLTELNAHARPSGYLAKPEFNTGAGKNWGKLCLAKQAVEQLNVRGKA